MFAAGLQKNSVIDFPGKISCVVFLSGCNFTCPYCHNPELAKGAYPTRISQAQLLDFAAGRRPFLDGVVISGGEPTLHAGLGDLCRAFREKGLAVKLDTNGSRPDVLAGLLHDQVLDFVALDLKTAPDHYGPPLCPPGQRRQIIQSIELMMGCGLPYEFRTTCVRPFIDKLQIEAIARAIEGARQWTLQTFRSTTLLNPDFFHDSDPGFAPEEMHALQTLAAPWVQRCTVR